MITITDSDYNMQSLVVLILLNWPGLLKTDNNNSMITLSMNTISGFHCLSNIHSKCINFTILSTVCFSETSLDNRCLSLTLGRR